MAASINVNDMFMLGYLLNTNDDARNNKWKYTTLKVDTFTKFIEGLRNWLLLETSSEHDPFAPVFS